VRANFINIILELFEVDTFGSGKAISVARSMKKNLSLAYLTRKKIVLDMTYNVFGGG